MRIAMKSIIETIYDAQKGAYEIEKVTDTHEKFSIEEAYTYQRGLVDRLIAEGSVLSGYKMGLTSREKMVQMGIDAPIYGVLLEEMLVHNETISYEKLIHPKAEPEIAVLLKADVPADADEKTLEAAIGYMAPAIEVIDSRFKDFKFTMADVVADNCSASAYAVGKWVPYPAEGVDINDIKVKLIINGAVQTEGSSSAVLGSPIASLMELKQSLAKIGKEMKKDQLILTGAITTAIRFYEGDTVTVEGEGIGSVTFH